MSYDLNIQRVSNSKSSVLYSIPAEKRFLPIENVATEFNLEHNSTLSQRTTSIGSGKRYDFTKNNQLSVAPNNYRISREITTNEKYSIGLKLKIVTSKDITPSPNCYNIHRDFSTSKKSDYTIPQYKRFKITDDNIKSNFPGPGRYRSTTNLTNGNRTFDHKNQKLIERYDKDFINETKLKKSNCNIYDKKYTLKYPKKNKIPEKDGLSVMNKILVGPGSQETNISQFRSSNKIIKRNKSAKWFNFKK